MTQITVAKQSGFCKGVEFAVNTALNLEAENVYVLGEIIHNEDVVKLLEEKGIIGVLVFIERTAAPPLNGNNFSFV